MHGCSTDDNEFDVIYIFIALVFCIVFVLQYRESKEITLNMYNQISEIYDSNPESRPFIRRYMNDGYISLRERDTILVEFKETKTKPITIDDVALIKAKISK